MPAGVWPRTASSASRSSLAFETSTSPVTVTIDAPASVVVLMERSMFSPFPYSASAVVSVAASELVMDWSFEVTKLFMPHVSSGSTSSALL